MEFFSKLGKKASNTAKGVGEKTSKLASETKLRMKMSDCKSKINDIYEEIGKKVYEKYAISGEIDIKKDLEEECTKIDVLTAEIETHLKEIRKLNDKKQCVKCFTEIDIEAKFCEKCGAEQPEVCVKEDAQENTNDDSNLEENV